MTQGKTAKKRFENADVLVVGAGPAGITAAKLLSRSGAKVTLVDRHTRPGSKACAGGLTSSTWRPAGIDPDRPTPYLQRFDSIVVHAYLGSVKLTRRDGAPMMLTADRIAWTDEQLEDLRANDVDVRLGQRLIGAANGVATTTAGQIPYGVMVGADGAASRVRRLLGLGRGLTLKAWQVRLPRSGQIERKLNTQTPHIWFDPVRFGAGYAWAFPFGDELRLGCGVSNKAPASSRIRKAFYNLLSAFDIIRTGLDVEAGSIASGYIGHRFGRTFLAGDAAGLASPITGEGISQALISGEEVAREILDPAYRSSLIPAIAAEHRRTHDVITLPGCALVFETTPLLLRLPLIRDAIIRKYMS